MPFCRKCGRYIEERPGVRFCPYCGASLRPEQEFEGEAKSAEETNHEKFIELKVAEPIWKDIGKRIARIDSKSLAALELSPGEIIKITGKRSTVAIVQPSYKQDDGMGLIRIDDEVRKNAGVSIGDHVKVSKVNAKQATKIILASPHYRLAFVEDPSGIAKDKLMNRPVMKNDMVTIDLLGIAIEFKVASTSPADAVIVTKNTQVEVITDPLHMPLEEGWPVYLFPANTDPVILKLSNDQIEILTQDYSQIFAIKYNSIIDVRAEVRKESSPTNVVASTSLFTLGGALASPILGPIGPIAGLLTGSIAGIMTKDAHYFLVIEFLDKFGRHRKVEFESTRGNICDIASQIYKKLSEKHDAQK